MDRQAKKVERELRGDPKVFVFINKGKWEEDEPIVFVRGDDHRDAYENLKNNLWFDEDDYMCYGELDNLRNEVIACSDKVVTPDDL